MKYLIAAALLAASFTVSAGNDGCNNRCGDETGGSTATATGGNANALAGAVAGAAAVSGSSSSVGDVKAYGGSGGSSVAFGGQGGNAHQGQQQSNVGVNSQGQHQSASSDQSQSQGITSTIGATGSGNSTSVGGQSTSVSYRNERSAPPVFLGNMAPTVSCAGGFNAGASSQGGSGAFGFTWISADCKQVVAGQNMLTAGETRLACEVFRQTDGFKRAARRNPALNEIACK